MKFRSAITAAVTAAVSAGMLSSVSASGTIEEGWLIWHRYSSYESGDSQLFIKDSKGKITEIRGDFTNPMNGSFGYTPDKAVFMAIDTKADEWDIYLYDGNSNTATNLTRRSGYRNEDPKWSPDGKGIVFKRGYWNHSVDDFTYNLAYLNIEDMSVRMLTDDLSEEAMPCFSDDGKTVYYAKYTGRHGEIASLDIRSGKETIIFSQENITAYYPVYNNGNLYFTKWYSAQNHHDQLMCFDGKEIKSLPFNSEYSDCSDICPVSAESFVYSSTADGNRYSLYYFNGNTSIALSDINTEKNELGADFYSMNEFKKKQKSRKK